jgi:hypothetical protein
MLRNYPEMCNIGRIPISDSLRGVQLVLRDKRSGQAHFVLRRARHS